MMQFVKYLLAVFGTIKNSAFSMVKCHIPGNLIFQHTPIRGKVISPCKKIDEKKSIALETVFLSKKETMLVLSE